MATSPRNCRVCYQPMKGHNREVCQLQNYDNRQNIFREADSKSEPFDYSDATTTSGWSTYSLRSYASPPITPPQSPSGRSTVSTNASTTVSEKQVLRELAPPPPRYPTSILSDASFRIPETGPFHRVNPRFRGASEPPNLGRESSLAPTEPNSIYSSNDNDSLASVNIRGASPGPSAFEYINSYRGPLGPSISESGRSNATVRPAAIPEEEILHQAPSVHVGGDRSTILSGVTVASTDYDYWPGNQIMTLPPSPRYAGIHMLLETMETMPSRAVAMFEAMGNHMRDNKPALVLQVMISFGIGLFVKKFM